MAIKIRIKTEGDHREPYEFEAEITQDTIVASMDLVNALASAAMQNEQMRDSLTRVIGGIADGVVKRIIDSRLTGFGNPEVQKKIFDAMKRSAPREDMFRHDNVEPRGEDDEEKKE